MSDGRIVIDVAANTKGLEEARKQIDGFAKELGKVGKDGTSKSRPFDNIGDSAKQSEPSVKKLITSIGAAQLAVKALGVVTSSLGDAVKRVDTMNQFPKMMEQLGFSSEDATRSIETLSAGIDGLPTALDTVVDTTQRLAMITNDLGEATKLTLALNNAFLASGKGPAEAARGLEQFTQMLSTGTVDMQSWKTLVETMPQALDMVAKSLLGAEAGQMDLYAALKDGEITFQDFTDAIILANDELSDLAQVGTEGIATSFTNLQTAVVRGVANMVTAFDELVKSVTGKTIAQNLNSLKGVINSVFNTMTGVIKGSTPIVQGLVVVFDLLLKTLKFLAPVIVGVTTAILLLNAVRKVTEYFKVMDATVKALQGTKLMYITVTKAVTSEAIAGTVAQKALGIAYGLLTGQLSIATVATTTLKVAMTALSGPIGWVIAGIATVVAVGVGLWQTVGQTSDKVKELTESTNEADSATRKLVNSAKESSKAFDKQIGNIESNADANRKMIKSLDDLAKKEVKTKADRKEITSLVDSLNHSMKDLNLTYDKERNSLNESTQALLARVDAIEKQEKANATLERLNQINQEQEALEAQAIINKRELTQAQNELSDASFNWFGKNNELKESVENLQEAELALAETKQSLTAEYQLASDQYAQALAEQELAIQQYVEAHGVSYDILSDKQKTVVDDMKSKFGEYRDAAVDMFGQIEDTMKGTNDAGKEYVKSSSEIYNELITNLEHNQAVLETLEDNMNSLRDRFEQLGLDSAILEQLANLGPEAAPYIQALADSSDEELANLSTTFSEGGETAMQAFLAAFGIDESQLPDGFSNLISDVETSLQSQIEEADFGSLMEPIGEDLIEGAISGVEGKSEGLATATSDAAQDGIDSFKETSGVQSPSTVFKSLTGFWIEGAVNGVVENTDKLVQAVKELAEKSVKPMEEIKSRFESAGRSAGQAFNSGLASQEGAIVATARRIARNAQSAINNVSVSTGGGGGASSGGATARAMSVQEGPRLMSLSAEPQLMTMSAMSTFSTPQLPKVDTYSATGGYEYAGRSMAQSAVNNNRQAKDTQRVANQTLGVLKDLVDISERGFKRQLVAQTFLDKKNVSEELNEPLQRLKQSNENINKLLRGEWA